MLIVGNLCIIIGLEGLNMLSKKQKTKYFKLKASANYRASLALEGLTAEKKNSSKILDDLKLKYAR